MVHGAVAVQGGAKAEVAAAGAQPRDAGCDSSSERADGIVEVVRMRTVLVQLYLCASARALCARAPTLCFRENFGARCARAD